jgi:hypothetical protein
LDRRWLDPRAGLDDVEKTKFFTLPNSNSGPSVVQPVASCYPGSSITVKVNNMEHHVLKANDSGCIFSPIQF